MRIKGFIKPKRLKMGDSRKYTLLSLLLFKGWLL